MTRFLTATAPVRIADLGGWTDTWFAGHGLVCNVAVQPGVEVELAVTPGAGAVVIDARNFGDRYRLDEGRGRHPLLEACIDEVGVPAGLDVTVSVGSEVPPGASTGTSAAVAVALVGALVALSEGVDAVVPAAVAARAHRVEAVRLRRQSGIQDQRASAHGGISRITLHRYPDDVAVAPVVVPAEAEGELERRLVLVFLGRTHVSSAVHESVIEGLEGAGVGEREARLEPLRRAAADGIAALEAGDLQTYGRALVANTAAQEVLHPALVGAEARRALDAARGAGGAGWKVNGAGGDGGSVTLLAGAAPGDRERLVAAVTATDPSFVVVPTTIDRRGLRVRESG